MPTIIDSLVVMFGLDPRGFQQGAKVVSDTDRKTRDQLDKSNRQTEAHAKKVATAYRNVGMEIKNLVLVAAGATGITDLVKNLVTGDAATGRLATNLGLATENVSAWEGAIKRIGGSASDADTALQGMVTAFQNYKLTGTTGHDADFQGLGVGLNDLKNPENALLKIAAAGEKLSRPEFVARLQRIGIPESAINLLERGRGGVERLLAEQRRLGVVTDEDAAAAIRFQDAWAQVSSRLQGNVRPAVTGLLNDVLSLTNAMEQMSARSAKNAQGTNPVKDWLDSFQTRLFGTPGNRTLGGHAIDAIAGALGIDTSKSLLGQGSNSRPDTPGLTVTPPPASIGGGRRARGGTVALHGNNPGGINDGDWASRQPGYAGSNGRYARFRTMEDGLAAQRSLLRSYVARGYNTPAKIASRWAPRGDGNDSGAYARNIARELGIGVNDRITGAAVGRFSIAQANQENSQFRTLRGARRVAGAGGGGSTSTSTSETNVGTIVVNAPGADADTIAAKLPAAIKRRGLVTQSNSGMSG